MGYLLLHGEKEEVLGPFTSIGGFGTLLREAPKDGSVRAWLETGVIEDAEQLKACVEELGEIADCGHIVKALRKAKLPVVISQ
jgi:hypothetical protein